MSNNTLLLLFVEEGFSFCKLETVLCVAELVEDVVLVVGRGGFFNGLEV